MKSLIERIKFLPKVEVSFQDDFSGSAREYVLTPTYILHALQEIGIRPKIGEEILLWEKDVNENGEDYYLCHIGKIVENKIGDSHFFQDMKKPELSGVPIRIELDTENYFNLPSGNDIL